jgi:hypothetical protein
VRVKGPRKKSSKINNAYPDGDLALERPRAREELTDGYGLTVELTEGDVRVIESDAFKVQTAWYSKTAK